MPMIDWPLDRLATYQGCSRRPENFDEFWSAGLAELSEINPQIELIPASFVSKGVECFDLYFVGSGGARIHAKYLRPVGAKNCPVILEFHGYSGNSGDWTSKLAYGLNGFCVVALDCRGQGGLSQDIGGIYGNTLAGHITRGIEKEPKDLLYYHIFLDTARLTQVVSTFSEVDSDRMMTTGSSQGGALALVCAALTPTIKGIAAAYPFLSDYRRVWDMDLCRDAYEDIITWFRRFDPLHNRHEEIFGKLDYIDVVNFTPRIKGKVLWALGQMDTICPPSTQFAGYNHLTCPKEMLIYPDFGHDYLPGYADKAYEFLTTL